MFHIFPIIARFSTKSSWVNPRWGLQFNSDQSPSTTKKRYNQQIDKTKYKPTRNKKALTEYESIYWIGIHTPRTINFLLNRFKSPYGEYYQVTWIHLADLPPLPIFSRHPKGFEPHIPWASNAQSRWAVQRAHGLTCWNSRGWANRNRIPRPTEYYLLSVFTRTPFEDVQREWSKLKLMAMTQH